MEFDTQEHRQLCIQLIESTNFTGKVVDLIFEFKKAVISATIKGKNIEVQEVNNE